MSLFKAFNPRYGNYLKKLRCETIKAILIICYQILGISTNKH